jgi:hypothetical protein
MNCLRINILYGARKVIREVCKDFLTDKLEETLFRKTKEQKPGSSDENFLCVISILISYFYPIDSSF